MKSFSELRNQPLVLTAPSRYPTDKLAAHALQRAGVRALTRVDGEDLNADVHDWVASLMRPDESDAGIIACNFDKANWGLQRGLYDACRERGAPLIALASVTKGYDKESNLVVDHRFEMGVSDRFRFWTLPYLDYRIFCRDDVRRELESTITDPKNWREGLFPFEQLLQG